MKQMYIGKSGIQVSAVGMGAWAIGGDSSWGASDDSESVRAIHRARELGVTLLDTAPAYGLGHSEDVVGRALEGRRGDYILSTKCGLRWDTDEGSFQVERDGVTLRRNTSAASLELELERSLRRLRTDCIDIYIVHWQSLPDFPVPVAETMGFLLKAKESGKIRAIGASNVNAGNLAEYLACGQLDLIQEKYSMLDRAKGDELFELCGRNGVTFQCYSPLERGALTGKYRVGDPVNMGRAKAGVKWYRPEFLPKIAGLLDAWGPLCKKYDCTMTNLVIAWTAAQGNGSNVNVMVGARTTAQIEENVRGGAVVLDPADIEAMRKDVEALESGEA
ncbi:MAG: aldo/keto reductase [Treponema sp.]|jgi:methylglyoxal reductase|nr:aldo/keto reductase [Treponema sp.]